MLPRLSHCAGSGISQRVENGCGRDLFPLRGGSGDAQELGLIGVLQNVAERTGSPGGDNPGVFIVPGQQHSCVGRVLMDGVVTWATSRSGMATTRSTMSGLRSITRDC